MRPAAESSPRLTPRPPQVPVQLCPVYGSDASGAYYIARTDYAAPASNGGLTSDPSKLISFLFNGYLCKGYDRIYVGGCHAPGPRSIHVQDIYTTIPGYRAGGTSTDISASPRTH